jgi:cell fate (sporulation/competence/biofilm development) regulator YlbF (YheA/YmcA/DUF963 family)
MTVTSVMPLIERMRKAANCVIFLDGSPEPAADVADMLRKAADRLEDHDALVKYARAMEAENARLQTVIAEANQMIAAALGKTEP